MVPCSDQIVQTTGGCNKFMGQGIREILNQYVKVVEKIYGKHLKQIYCSRAEDVSGENEKMEVLLLVDLPAAEIRRHSEELAEVGFEYLFRHGVRILPSVKSAEEFRRWNSIHPLYQAVKQKGILLYQQFGKPYLWEEAEEYEALS